jgi:redox-sensitive bicupin YhaK (pirin superfamily)
VKGADIPVVTDDDGTQVRVIVGDFWGKRGPVDGVAAEPRYLDVFVPAGKRKTLKVEIERHAFAYVFEGDGQFATASKPFGVLSEKEVNGQEILVREPVGDRSLVLFDSGDEITVQAGDRGIRFLLVSGKPIQEPVAWYGPIVMNTQAELQQAVSELRNGTFIRN